MENKDLNFTIEEISKADLPFITKLALENGGNDRLSEKYFEHRYYNTPSKSFSLRKLVVNNEIEGYTTTNNFELNIDNKSHVLAIPENVLISLKVRGKGMHNKLYFATETDNLENKKVDYFFAFPNEISRPIYLNKLSYMQADCPDVLVFFTNPLHLFYKKHYNQIADIESIKLDNAFSFNNALVKSYEFYLWRYKLYDKNNLHIISISNNGKIIGYSFFIVQKKKGIKFLVLTDIISYDEKKMHLIIKECKIYTAIKHFPFFVMFDLEGYIPKTILTLKLKNRINFLVKGKTVQETKMLSKIKFNLFFGDLDIL